MAPLEDAKFALLEKEVEHTQKTLSSVSTKLDKLSEAVHAMAINLSKLTSAQDDHSKYEDVHLELMERIYNNDLNSVKSRIKTVEEQLAWYSRGIIVALLTAIFSVISTIIKG